MTTEGAYVCPGIDMDQPVDAPDEGYVACYRAGHMCPPKVALISENATHRTTVYRCPCCGDHGVMSCVPLEWVTSQKGEQS
jgi:hypothetical protein